MPSGSCGGNGANLVLCDLFMPGGDGLETIRELRSEFPDVKVVAMSGGALGGKLNLLPAAEFLGAVAVLPKPFKVATALAAVERGLDHSAADLSDPGESGQGVRAMRMSFRGKVLLGGKSVAVTGWLQRSTDSRGIPSWEGKLTCNELIVPGDSYRLQLEDGRTGDLVIDSTQPTGKDYVSTIEVRWDMQ
jgi:Response regulator receiver domain